MRVANVIAVLQCLVGEMIHTVNKLNQHVFLNVAAVEYLPPDKRDYPDANVIIRYGEEDGKPAGLTFASVGVETIEQENSIIVINGEHIISWMPTLEFPQ